MEFEFISQLLLYKPLITVCYHAVNHPTHVLCHINFDINKEFKKL